MPGMTKQSIRVWHPEDDHPLVPKENLLIAGGADGAALGSASLHPYFDPDLEPEHPHNISLLFHPGPEQPLDKKVKDALLQAALARAAEIKNEIGADPIRFYACLFADQKPEIDYFLQKRFQHDESMLILERELTAPISGSGIPDGFQVYDDFIKGEENQEHLLAAHREVFPRHPYSSDLLGELKNQPGWLNLTLLSGEEVAGNIMLMMDDQDPSSGWIEDLFITKAYRRRGGASFLVSSGLKHFRELGLEKTRLELWSANRAGRSLYQRFDFQEAGETEIALSRMI